MRILCVCTGGNVRSATLARMLRRRGYEAINCGVDSRWSDLTIIMLFNWADRILIQRDSAQKLEKRIFQKKSTLMSNIRGSNQAKFDFRFDVGPDDWQQADHSNLIAKYQSLLRIHSVEDPPNAFMEPQGEELETVNSNPA